MKYILYILLSVFSTLACAQNNKKYALVIGNASYEKSPLRNPLNDADDVSYKLRTLGFEVISAKDCKTRSDMRKVLDVFCKKASNAEAGVFYYSGHGMQLTDDGGNYLVPINAEMNDEADVSEECLSLNHVLKKMDENGINMKVAIIDACRDNPFRTWHRSGSKKGLSTPGAVPSGTFMAFATSANDVAADGKDRNSPFTNAFLSALNGDDLEIDNVFKEVKRLVKEKTNGGQRPWTSNDLSEHFYFSKNNKPKSNVSKNNNESAIIVLDGDKLNDHEYVDLGLSVRWATCNVGADQSYKEGISYAWGDVESKAVRFIMHSTQGYSSFESYFDCYTTPNDERIYLDYYSGSKERIVPNSGHDVAREKLGSIWRLPTQRECEELRDRCVWKQSKKKGQQGFTVTGPNGNSIFLPLSGVYWTSELVDDDKAWSMELNSQTIINDYSPAKMSYRYLAGYIRPVFDLNGSMANASPYNDEHSGMIGHLDIDCSPKEAEVFINGKSYGAAQSKIDLPVGDYSIEIRKEGYKTIDKKVYVRSYHTSKIKENLISLEDEKLYEEAMRNYNNKEYDKCIGVYVSLADKNIADAQYMLGICYKNGFGITKNNVDAIKWFKKAAEQGHAKAQYEYGSAYDSGGIATKSDESLAARWIRRAALQGDPKAQYHLGFLHTKGRGADFDPNAARFWFEKAADQGYKRAQERLGH